MQNILLLYYINYYIVNILLLIEPDSWWFTDSVNPLKRCMYRFNYLLWQPYWFDGTDLLCLLFKECNPDVDSGFVSAGYPGFQTATYTSRSYAGITPGYTYQFPGNHSTFSAPVTCFCHINWDIVPQPPRPVRKCSLLQIQSAGWEETCSVSTPHS